MTPEQQRLNAEKSLALASHLFPHEEWIPKKTNIWIAKSRLSGGYKEQAKLYREIADVQILTDRGSVAYFLPEDEKKEGKIKICVDTVIDGELVELKTVSGNRNTLGTAFEQGFRQGLAVRKDHPEIKTHSIFIRLRSNLSIGSVKAKIAGELKSRPENGKFICYFEHIGELHTWSFEELRTIIGDQKNRYAQ
jgi:hypothetical protein